MYTQAQLKQAWSQRPDLQTVFTDPSAFGPGAGMTRPGVSGWTQGGNISQWAEKYGAKELPGIFGTVQPQEMTQNGLIDLSKSPANTTALNGVVSNISAQNTSYQDLQKLILDTQKKYLDMQTQQATQSQTEQQGWLGKMASAITQKEAMPAPDTQTLLTNELAKWGVTPDTAQTLQTITAQYNDYNKQLADLGTQEQLAQANNEQRPVGMVGINAESNNIAKIYAIKKSGVAAQASVAATTLEAMRGNITLASNMAQSAVNAATYDYQQKVSDLEWSINTYSTLYQNASNELKTAWDNAYKTSVDMYNTVKQQMTDNMNLVTDAASKGVNLGLSADQLKNMDTSEVTAIYQNKISEVVAKQNAIVNQPSGGGTSTSVPVIEKSPFTQTQTNNGAQNAGMSFEDFKKLDDNTKNYFINGSTELNATKKMIDDAKTNSEDPTQIEKEISESSVPDAVKDWSVKYLWSVFERPKKKSFNLFHPSTW